MPLPIPLQNYFPGAVTRFTNNGLLVRIFLLANPAVENEGECSQSDSEGGDEHALAETLSRRMLVRSGHIQIISDAGGL
jgi:hypothetical protein